MSEKWRIEGNRYYTSATEDFCSAVREERLQKSLRCYYKAVELASNKEEYASAAKNFALASWRLGDICTEKSQATMMHHHFKETVKYFTKAQEAGRIAMSHDWNTNINTRIEECIRSILQATLNVVSDIKKRVQVIDAYVHQMPERHPMLPEMHLFLVDIIFKGAVVSVSAGLYKEALTLLRDCNYPLEEALRLCKGNEEMSKEIDVARQDVFYQTSAAESMQARALGDALLEQALQDEEIVNMDTIWDVIDWYRQAIVLTREKEVELEAIALSRMGVVFHKVLKLSNKAKECFHRCVQLALSLHPRTFNNDDWFKEARDILEKYQEKVIREEDQKHQQERAKYVEELKEELEKLKKYEDDDHIAFLKFVYVTWPPKKPDFKMDDPTTLRTYEQRKKAVQKAVVHYHPDKVDVEKHGMKWKVLCEEIEKILTRKYEQLK